MDGDTLARYFGSKLLEACVGVLRKKINEIRLQVELPEITEQEIIDAIENELNNMEDYSWME